MENQIPQGLDPTAFILTKAIKRSESSGASQYTQSGDNGTSTGAYQIQNKNWKPWAGQFLGDENAPMTEENQNKLAYTRVKSFLDSGMTQTQIASEWNSGNPDPNAVGKGHNDALNVDYDVPAYVKKVQSNYEAIQSEIKNGFNSSPYSNPDKPFQSNYQKDNRDLLQKTSDVIGAVVPGAGVLGQTLGTYGGRAYEKAKGLLGGQDNSKFYDKSTPTAWENTKAAAKTLGTIGALATGGELLSGLSLAGNAALTSGGVETAVDSLTGGQMEMEEFGSLNPTEKYNLLKEALKNPTVELSDVEEEQVKQALAKLRPSVASQNGLGNFSERNPKLAKAGGLVKGIAKNAVNYGLIKMAGDDVGKAYNYLTKNN